MKRRASLLGRPSAFHAGVTIFEPNEIAPETLVRQSKRLKVSTPANPSTSNCSQQRHGAPSSSTAPRSSEDTVSGEVTTSRASKTAKVTQLVKTEVDSEEAAGSSTSAPATGRPKPKRVASPRKPRPIPTALETPHPAPPRWREAYDTIKRMRQRIVAPVDTMGCDQAQLKETDPKNQRFSTLVSLMLSSQTKDEVTDAAVAKLREAVGGTLSIDAVLGASESAISEAICKVGFWRRKTQYIRQAAQKLKDEFGGDVPKTVDELCSLPGVGPKMAFLALQVAWKVNAGIGVDVHVHRITNRLGWHKSPTKTPEETRLNLQSWLPVELHPDINHLLVGFGQTICAPVGPKCDQCELSDGLCPSARKVVKASSSKTRSKKIASAVSVEADRGAGPQIEVKFEEESEEHKVDIQTLAAAPERISPTPDVPVKYEDTS
ncbi:DNA glycosylase [Dichomitus squalens]|uniref:Endonuclease III homolog n=1 Tax=Dichomitus squalens TaxID=114155 RepID=A0A4Q9NGI7_9APHY|nr:DNA glycosylase [Dichomitus squalens]TBU57020.1 DNA glycosylase [Dichomitus squalens]